MTSSIGSHTFINLSGIPAAPQERVHIESQAGVDGVTAWLLGKVGKEFTLNSVRDCVSLADALTQLAAYQATPALGPQTLIYGGQTLSFPVKVVRVDPVEVKTITGGFGGVLGQSGGLLRARWILMPWVI